MRVRQGEWVDGAGWCKRVRRGCAAKIDDLPALAHAFHLMHLAYIVELGSPERAALRGLALPIYEELGDLLGRRTR